MGEKLVREMLTPRCSECTDANNEDLEECAPEESWTSAAR